jgi:hypothetical protein
MQPSPTIQIGSPEAKELAALARSHHRQGLSISGVIE